MVAELLKSIDDNMKKASAAKKADKKEQSSLFASMASSDSESIKLYQPILQRMEKNLTFLEKLDENWGISITKLEHEIKRKRTEYETIREMYKGLSAAEMFASEDNEKTRIFKESLDALENSVTQKIAAIDDFEKRSKGVMDGIDIEKQLMQDDGLRLLEEYEENGGLFLDSPENATGELTIINPTIPKSTTFSKILRERSAK
jgi:DNA polymerase III alpha subunit